MSTPRRAFTLIELLVVVSIVAVLAALLMPAIGMVRDAARGASCANAIRQVGMAVQAYAGDNDDLLVPLYMEASPGNRPTWMQQLVLYVDGKGDYSATERNLLYYGCPALRASPTFLSQGKWGPAFAANQTVWRCRTDPLRTSSGSPTSIWMRSTNLLCDTAKYNPAAIPLHAIREKSGRMIFGEAVDAWYINSSKTVGYAASPEPRHRGRTNVLFADGHTASLTQDGAAETIDDPAK